MSRSEARKKAFIMIAAVLIAIAASNPSLSSQGGTWTTKSPMPTPRGDHAIGVVNGIMYVVGGGVGRDPYFAIVEAYDPRTNRWIRKAPMPTPRSSLAVGVVDGILYAVGGISRHMGGRILDTVEAYDPKTNTWTRKAPMTTPRWGLSIGVVDGILYAIGGSGGIGGEISQPLTTVEAYDPSTNTWTTKAPMPSTRVVMAVGVMNETLYAIGGSCCKPGHGSRTLGTVEAYDAKTNRWTVRDSMPTPRARHVVGVVNQVLYVVGGFSDEGLTKRVEAYDPVTKRWSRKADIPSPRSLHAIGVVDGILYVVGGVTARRGGNPPDDLIVEYTSNLLAFKP